MSVAVQLRATDIADYFLWLANDTGSFMSNLKLQKLVYYAQAWHLAIYDRPLFDEDFQAWVHGPVLPALFQKYQHFAWKPIDQEVHPNLPASIVKHLAEVADEYFSCDAYELERMSCTEDPWQRARQGLVRDQISENIIHQEWIKEYYKSRVEED
jgi:uncharacterized phage-associated protein